MSRHRQNYPELIAKIEGMPVEKRRGAYQYMCLNDMYFLLRYGCDIPVTLMEYDFAIDRCNAATDRLLSENGMDKYLIMVFREGFKSLIFNYGVNIRNILAYPDFSTCIFSYKFGRARDHLIAIKTTLERNKKLKSWFPHVLYDTPPRDGWSADRGLVVKRATNRREPTIMAAGLIDGQPTGMHYNFNCMDDVVTEDSVRSPNMIEQTTKGFKLAENLRASLGEVSWMWGLGTYYKYGDTYTYLEKTGQFFVEKIPCRDPDGRPYVHTEQQLSDKLAIMGRYVFNCQMMLDPVPSGEQTFDIDKIQEYRKAPNINDMRVVLFWDPACAEKTRSNHDPDYTAMWVVGYDRSGYQYWLAGIYDRIKGPDAVRKAFELVRKYNISFVSAEEVGAVSLSDFIRDYQVETGLSFKLEPFKPRKYGSKTDRIMGALLARIESGRLKFPVSYKYVQKDGAVVDLMNVLRQELEEFPHASGTTGSHDDFIDCGSHFYNTPRFGRAPKPKVRVDGPWAGYSEELLPIGAKQKKNPAMNVVYRYT